MLMQPKTSISEVELLMRYRALLPPNDGELGLASEIKKGRALSRSFKVATVAVTVTRYRHLEELPLGF
jgi:hypothetical protein